MSRRECLGRLREQGRLVIGLEHRTSMVVQHDHVAVQREHHAGPPAAGPEVLLEESQL